MWIKVHYNININNTFTCLEFSNLILFEQIYVSIFGKMKIIKSFVGFKLMTYKFALNALNLCALLLVSNFERE